MTIGVGRPQAGLCKEGKGAAEHPSENAKDERGQESSCKSLIVSEVIYESLDADGLDGPF